MWEYVKGSEADFEGAPEWATECVWSDKGSEHFVYWLDKMTCQIQSPYFSETKFGGTYGWRNYVKAQRRKVDDLQSRTNDANLQNLISPKGPVGPIHYGDDCTPCNSEFDTVQRPAHYNQSGIECIDAIAAAVKGKSGIEASLVGNVIKYLWRYELKNGVEDVRKAQWYLDRLVKELSK